MVKIIERMIFKEDNSLKKKTRKFEVPGKITGSTMFFRSIESSRLESGYQG